MFNDSIEEDVISSVSVTELISVNNEVISIVGSVVNEEVKSVNPELAFSVSKDVVVISAILEDVSKVDEVEISVEILSILSEFVASKFDEEVSIFIVLVSDELISGLDESILVEIVSVIDEVGSEVSSGVWRRIGSVNFLKVELLILIKLSKNKIKNKK